MAKKKDVDNESEARIKIAEDNIWNGIKAGIEATENHLTIPELLSILLRICFQYNKMNLEYTKKEVHKDAVMMDNAVRSLEGMKDTQKPGN